MSSGEIEPTIENVMIRMSRLEKAVLNMAWWLVQCQSGFGITDANGIEDIIEGKTNQPEERSENSVLLRV